MAMNKPGIPLNAPGGEAGLPAPGKAALVVALDTPDAPRALELAGRLHGLPLWLKIGLELFTAEGPALVRELAKRGQPVFLDLKFHDIPNTVRGAVRSAAGLGIHMSTLHLGGGEAMCRAAVAGRAEGAAGSKGPLLMGVSVLTSQAGEAGALAGLVVERALMARDCGLDGVVCSGHEAAAVKKACGKDFLCLCPGIRFAEEGKAGHGDQARVCTPAEAVLAGADFIVMGRPVIRSEDPASAALRALEEMESARPARD